MKNFDNIFNREKRNSARESDFKNKNYDNKSYDRKRRDDRDRPEMFEAVCATCGKKCEVPFRPTGDKPVYCSDCFSKQGGGESKRRDFGRPNFRERREFSPERRGPSIDRDQFDALNAKLDTVINLLSRIVPDKDK